MWVERSTVWFQPTLLAFTRSDPRAGACAAPSAGFNPRSSRSRGATATRMGSARSAVGFNPRSSRSRGATIHYFDARQGVRCFNPRSSRSRGATCPANSAYSAPKVSTHAPRVHEERQDDDSVLLATVLFQPTLLAFTRSDRAARIGANYPRLFQPTLLAFTRSDAPRVTVFPAGWFQPTLLAFTRSDPVRPPSSRRCRVSTHAPRVHEERQPWSRCFSQW